MIANPFDEDEYKKVLKTIHIREVAATIASYKPNRVLGTPPPEINKEESKVKTE